MRLSAAQIFICLLVLTSGMAALSWEVLWQIKSTLALGVSAWGTALTLALTMGGMGLGAWAMGRVLRGRTIAQPLRLYCMLEWVVGVSGLFLGAAFQLAEQCDSWAYAAMPGAAPVVHVASIAVIIGIPACAMGATLPVLGLMGRQTGISIAVLYGLNTLGAAAGTLLAAFALIPALGVAGGMIVVALVNLAAGGAALLVKLPDTPPSAPITQQPTQQGGGPSALGPRAALAVIFLTGFCTFALEVAWFRSFTAAFLSTTDAFAIMLSCVLLALGAGSLFVPLVKKTKALGPVLAWAGILVLLATPVIERFDLFIPIESAVPLFLFTNWFVMTFYAIGLPVLLIGIALPWVLDDQNSPRGWGKFYSVNTLAGIAGSIAAGWIFLPTIGFAATAWLVGGMLAGTGMMLTAGRQRMVLAVLAVTAIFIAVTFKSGIGETRVPGTKRFKGGESIQILQSYEGPDATATAVAFGDDSRALFIDGFVATQQADSGFWKDHVHYMEWMGHLPMLAHPDPDAALVICFGTGQTANAVRKENPQSLDIVEVNPDVFKLARYFPSNDAVLDDPRVHPVIMDGRAYLRRSPALYDTITLEPMPPGFAGTNALYSQQFYELARSRLNKNGVIAQWVPFHLISARDGASIAKTFQSVFPNAILWLDPPSKTGILLGAVNDGMALGTVWPGFDRHHITRDMTRAAVKKAVLLNRKALQDYAADGVVITDDNQFLAYGASAHEVRNNTIRGQNHAILGGSKAVP